MMYKITLYVVSLILYVVCSAEETEISIELRKHGIVPGIVPASAPRTIFITYPGGVRLIIGSTLKTEQFEEAPRATWASETYEYYTMLLVDPDTPGKENNKEWLHWLVVNIPDDNINAGETLCEYMGFYPHKNSGFHRHIFFLYKQFGKIKFYEPIIIGKSGLGRGDFKTVDFAKKYNLGDPIGVNFFRTEEKKPTSP